MKNNNRKRLFFLCVASSIIYAQLSTTQQSDIIIIRSTHLIHRRYYFIERLKRTMKLLAHYKQDKAKINVLINKNMNMRCLTDIDFNHKQIIFCVNEIINTRSLKPLFMVWDDFASYKFLEDKLFLEDFTKELFVITRDMVIEIPDNKSYNMFALKKLDDALHMPIELLVELIDEMANYLDTSYKTGMFLPYITSSIATKLKQFSDLKPKIRSEEIGTRIYYINRLQETKRLLKRLVKSNLSCLKYACLADSIAIIFDDRVDFFDEQVTLTIASLEKSGNFDPLIELYKEIKQFKYIDNIEFLRQSLIAIFIAEKNILVNLTSNDAQRRDTLSLEQIIPLYQKIESLPIEEVLTAIDNATVAINQLLNEKEGAEQKPWRELFSHYWWVQPLLIGGGILVKVAKHYNMLEKAGEYFATMATIV